MDVGLDIGGTKILGALVHDGRLIRHVYELTDRDRDAEHIIKNIKRVVTYLSKGADVNSVAFAVPGPYEGTALTACINIPSLVGVDLRKAVPYGLPLTLQRDNTSFAYGEYCQLEHELHEPRTVVGTIFGTGVSACKVADGMPQCYGHKGHKCTSDVYEDRTLEIKTVHEWLGKPGIEARFKELTGAPATLEQIWARDDAVARGFQQEIAMHAGTYLSHLTKVFDPSLIVIGGGQSQSPLVDMVRAQYPMLPIRRASNTSRSAILGAVELARKHAPSYV